MESDIVSKNKKNDIDKNVINDDIDNNKKEEQNSLKEPEQNQDKNKIESLNDYLYNKNDSSESENVDKDEINDNITKKIEKDKIKLEIIPNSEITPKKYRNSNNFKLTDFNYDFQPSSEKDKKGERYSATPGRYRMSFKKVFLTRSKTKNPSSTKKKSFKNIFRHIIKTSEKRNLKKYFDIWKNIDNKENSDIYSDKEDEKVLEIIKTNDLKIDNIKNNENLINEENLNEDKKVKKVKNSCLNGIYGICDTEDFLFDNDKEEHISIYGNEKSKKVSDNIQPHFSDFLKAMNCSIATFNLFTYYSQLHDNKFLIKKKFLPIWRKVK